MKQMAVVVTIVCVLVPALHVSAQEGAGNAAGIYIAEVIGQDVHVRSGPSATAYHCVKVSSPGKVSVVGQSGTWLKIHPPQGCYSVVSKLSVAVDAGAKTGKIVGENVWARAGGFPEEPGEYSMLQKALKANESVMILGQVESYYKIVPPSGAYFWIEAKNVKQAPTGVVTPPAPTTKPANGGTGGTGGGTVKPVPVKVEPKRHPDVIQLEKLDKELQAEYLKPAKDREYAALLAKFQAFEPAEESGVRPHVLTRIDSLEMEIQRQKDAATVAGVVDDVQKHDTDFRIAYTKIGTDAATRLKAPPAGKGIIVVSNIYSTRSSIGKRYILRDTKVMKINAYLVSVSKDNIVDLSDYAGKTVEVYGRLGYDRFMGTRVIDVQKVVILSESAALPKPPTPTIRPPAAKKAPAAE